MNRFAPLHSLKPIIVDLILDAVANPGMIASHYDMAIQTLDSDNNAMDIAMAVEAGYKHIAGLSRYEEDCETGDSYYSVTVQTSERVGIIVNDANQIITIEW